MHRFSSLALPSAVLFFLLLYVLGLGIRAAELVSVKPTETPPYMPVGAPLDPTSLLGTWYSDPCGDESYTFAADGTYQAQGYDGLAFDHSNRYRLVDGHHLEIDGLLYNAALTSDGHLDMFEWPHGFGLQRAHTPGPPTPTPIDTGVYATETTWWPTGTPLPPPVPTTPPKP